MYDLLEADMSDELLIDPNPVAILHVRTRGKHDQRVRYAMSDIDVVSVFYWLPDTSEHGRAHFLSRLYAVDNWRGPTYRITGGPTFSQLRRPPTTVCQAYDHLRKIWIQTLTKEQPLLLAQVAAEAGRRRAAEAEDMLDEALTRGDVEPQVKKEIAAYAMWSGQESQRYIQGLEEILESSE